MGVTCKTRTAMLAEIGVQVAPLARADVEAEVVAVGQRLRASVDVDELDASDASREAVVEWLRGLPVDQQADVVVLWLADREGARLRYDDFVARYDDLWAPSRDDVWVVEPTRAWVLELDHEELFTLRRTTPVA